MATNYKYTVCTRCFTYNQKQYILDALNGFVMQEISFPVVSVIVDDASTDGEQEVILDFFNENFDTHNSEVAYKEDADYGTIYYAQHRGNKNCFFAIVLLKENHYSQKKSKLLYITRWQDNAKYIALCEGDDYWTDSLKLQKQIAFLEMNPNCCMAACSAYWKDESGSLTEKVVSNVERELSTEEVILGGGGYLSTCTLVMRGSLARVVPKWRAIANVGDYPLQIQGTLYGTLHYLPDIMVVYRWKHKGSWTNKYLGEDLQMTYLHRKAEVEWMTELDRATHHLFQKAIYGHLRPYYPVLYRKKMVSTREYLHSVLLVGGYADYRSFLKNFVKHLIHYNTE